MNTEGDEENEDEKTETMKKKTMNKISETYQFFLSFFLTEVDCFSETNACSCQK